MRLKGNRPPAAGHKTDAFVLFRGEKAKGKLLVPDAALRKAGDAARSSGEFRGKAGETILLHGGAAGRRLLLVGLGSDKPDGETWRTAAGSAARTLEDHRLKDAIFLLPASADAGAAAEGAGLAAYSFDSMKSKARKATLRKVEVAPETGSNTGYAAAVRRAAALVEAASFARDLGNLPGNVAHAVHLAKRARDLAGGGISVKIHDRAAIKRLRMGAFGAVAQGSANEPRFIEMKYRGGGPRAETILLVGKGVTFDTGGISLKPGAKMEDMKFDMCGAAAVFGAMHAIKALKPRINVTAFVPATDNMPSGKAYRPGDIVKARNGKTIEVINTDAEGRLLLCDALAYAAEKKPACIIDLATLTGACVVALGDVASGLFSNNDKLRGQLEKAGKSSGELAWPMPLHPRFTKMMKSVYADLKNSGGRWGGACTAAAFLEQFVGDVPWAHIDIAGMAWMERSESYTKRGATGYGVRLLVEFVTNRAEG